MCTCIDIEHLHNSGGQKLCFQDNFGKNLLSFLSFFLLSYAILQRGLTETSMKELFIFCEKSAYRKTIQLMTLIKEHRKLTKFQEYNSILQEILNLSEFYSRK